MRVVLTSVFAIALAGLGAVSSVSAKQPPNKQPRCYDVEVQRPKEVKDEHKVTGTALGALAGGLLGNQVGGGSGKKVATAAGAVGGAFAGRKIQENQQNKTETVIERRCD
ncbi:glycine zipper 2TM domain-containing protein [Lysobacter cavernae]|uniref:Glycine zipper 2TM domain-containing protein n=1 Tax=Lysobacter cavernae TaxID=1685901 RepID=A0ABV7RJB1_9GAMM